MYVYISEDGCTFESVLALADEIALGARTFSAVLARIGGTFVYINLQEKTQIFFFYLIYSKLVIFYRESVC